MVFRVQGLRAWLIDGRWGGSRRRFWKSALISYGEDIYDRAVIATFTHPRVSSITETRRQEAQNAFDCTSTCFLVVRVP
jgi:hypothetical protein